MDVIASHCAKYDDLDQYPMISWVGLSESGIVAPW
jgi:hypothetical protein